MRIFLIAGKSGSGKGEVARIINEYYIYKLKKCAITSYSNTIKEFTKELTDWDGQPGNKPRKFMQELSDNIRMEDPEFLSKELLRKIPVYEKYVDILIVTDVRMPDEIDNIKENYEDVYAIYVDNQFQKSTLSLEEQAHITETSLEDYLDFDFTIANDSLDTLKDKIFKYLEGIDA